MTLRRLFRVATPLLLGATLVMMVHGHQVRALLLAIAFFAVYVGADAVAPSDHASRRREELEG